MTALPGEVIHVDPRFCSGPQPAPLSVVVFFNHVGANNRRLEPKVPIVRSA
jgi:hypothetical protein